MRNRNTETDICVRDVWESESVNHTTSHGIKSTTTGSQSGIQSKQQCCRILPFTTVGLDMYHVAGLDMYQQFTMDSTEDAAVWCIQLMGRCQQVQGNAVDKWSEMELQEEQWTMIELDIVVWIDAIVVYWWLRLQWSSSHRGRTFMSFDLLVLFYV